MEKYKVKLHQWLDLSIVNIAIDIPFNVEAQRTITLYVIYIHLVSHQEMCLFRLLPLLCGMYFSIAITFSKEEFLPW